MLQSGSKLLEIDYLNHLPESVEIILLTDPDESGDKIRKKLESQLNHFINDYVSVEKCNKHNKHGVAECDIFELQKALDKHVNKCGITTVTKEMLENLGVINSINSNNKIEVISRQYHLGKLTKNNIVKRINLMGVIPQELERTFLGNGN